MTATQQRRGGLIEREREQLRLDEALRAASAGNGSICVLRGEAGIGKTRLISYAGERADDLGLQHLTARGGDIERDLPWGGVRQLFDPVIAARTGPEREKLFAESGELARPVFALTSREQAPGGLAASVYGLYWALVALSAERPLLVSVDDAHWADEETLRWLGFLASRVQDLPVALLAAVRSEDVDADRPAITEMIAQPEVELLDLAPLTESGSAQLISSVLAATPHSNLVEACERATRGNPFLLGELTRELGATPGFDPSDADISAVRAVRPQTISRTVLLRLARLPQEATALARSIAVLGPAAQARDLASLAELDADAMTYAHSALARSGILATERGFEFAHPLVRDVIYEEMPVLERSAWHDRAARILDNAGADPTQIVPHLLEAQPGSDPWARQVLREAGATALQRGAPALASRLLERAIAEAVDPVRDSTLLLEAGRARFAAFGSGGIETLERALGAATDPQELTDAALELGRALHALGSHPQAADVYETAHRSLENGPAEMRELMRAHFVYTGLQDGEHHHRALEQLLVAAGEPRSPGPANDIITACHALGGAAAGAPAADCAALAEQAVADGWLLAERTPALGFAVSALIWSDRLDRAGELWDQALSDAREAGEEPWAAFASCFRGQVALRSGDLALAELSTRDSLEAAPIWDLIPPDPASFLCETLIELGRPQEAESVLDHSGYDRDLAERQGYNTLLYARALLHRAQGRRREALEDLRNLAARLAAINVVNPALYPWRSAIATLIVATDREEAEELTATELELARAFGAPRAIGIALIASGIVRPAGEGVEMLTEAVDVLSDSPARLEAARAQVELGCGLRRAGHNRDAREALRDGLLEAEALGAGQLMKRAREELATAGARPRRDALRGRDALTAAETRVARLAAEGMSNAEIAQSLFVVLRTVETHLTSAYRKLDISSRAELAQRLADTP